MSEPTPSEDQRKQSSTALAGFGPNEWLVDELYQQYLKDKNSVDRAWWDFFEDYKPSDGSSSQTNGGRQTAGEATPTPAPSAPSSDGAQSRADGPPPVQERPAGQPAGAQQSSAASSPAPAPTPSAPAQTAAGTGQGQAGRERRRPRRPSSRARPPASSPT